MRSTKIWAVLQTVLLPAFMVGMMLPGLADSQSKQVPVPPFTAYCELHYVKANTQWSGPAPGQDLGTVSVRQGSGSFWGTILADMTGPRNSRDNAGTNYCAVRDLSTALVPATIPGGPPAGTGNLCTGVVCIGKQNFLGQNAIDFVGFNAPIGIGLGIPETANPEYGGPAYTAPPLNGAGGWLDPLTKGVGGNSYQINTAWGRTHDMDVAIGLTTGQLESWLITAESSSGVYSLVAYYLSTMVMTGNPPVQPGAALQFTLQPPMVVTDLIVTSSPLSNTAWVVFIDSQNPQNPVAHTVPFTLGLNGGPGSGWGMMDPPGNPHAIPSSPPSGLPLIPVFPVPWPNALGPVVGMWEAQNPAGVSSYGYVGISLQNPASPFAPGDFVIIAAGGAHVGVAGIGGGPVSHVCTQAATVSGFALETASSAPIGSGWYLVTPLTQFIQVMGAIDVNGNPAYTAGGAPTTLYAILYPNPSAPTGVPMAHPGDIWNPITPTSTNFVCLPYLDSSLVDRFHIASPSTNMYYTTGGVRFAVVSNWGTVPPFPVQHFFPPPVTWPGSHVSKGRTNYRAEYALYFPNW